MNFITRIGLSVGIAVFSFTACGSPGTFPDGESAYQPCAPDGIPFVVSDSSWAADGLGNHRAVVRVSPGDLDVDAVAVTLPWRRADLNPARKRIVVCDASTGEKVKNVRTYNVSASEGVIAFQPNKENETYYIYYLPYIFRRGYGSGRWDSKPWEDYLPADKERDSLSASWDSSVWEQYTPGIDSKWYVSLPTRSDTLRQAQVLRFESRTRFDFPTPMGLIATQPECAMILERHPENPLLFTEDRAFPIRLTGHVPVRWIEKGPSDSFEGMAFRNEYYVWQIGVWCPREKLQNVKLSFSDLVCGNNKIDAAQITCFNQEGVSWDGNPLKFQVDVGKGKVQALWCGVHIPEAASPGRYTGHISLSADGLKERVIDLTIHVKKEILEDKGESDLWRHARLAWLNSTIGIDNNPVAPYKAMEIDGDTIRATGKTVVLERNGFPKSIRSNSREILAKPVRFVVETSNGTVSFDALNATPQKETDGLVCWRSSAEQGDIRFKCDGHMEFDGYIHYKIEVSSLRKMETKDIRLCCDYTPGASEYFIGIGYKGHKGGARPARHSWDWKGPWDSFWTGGVDAGLHTEFLGGTYHGPLLGDYKPAPPAVWANGGKGRVSIAGAEGESALAVASTGKVTLSPNPLVFEFAFMITPAKMVDTKKHFSERYSHGGGDGFDEAAEKGANIQNIHHASRLNPVINYPFIVRRPLIDFIKEQHRHNRKVKLYYTIRELTNYAAEIFALKSLNHEIFRSGIGHGLPWLCENLVDDYKMAWFTEITGDQYDASIVVNGFSRWINYYLEGLRWMLENYAIDGIYLDDVAYDRPVLKRMRKIMEKYRPGSLIDLHSHEQYSMGPANQYMGFFPYIDRLWFGEGFDYGKMMPDEWLITFSGIPFGLMSDMIDHVNPYLGMIYGATGRHGYEEKYSPAPVWSLWKSFGIEDAEMKGYWTGDCPVKTSHPNVKATVFLKPGEALISIGNFDSIQQSVKLSFDWSALGINPDNAILDAPEIESFQHAVTFNVRQTIPVEAKKGWLFLLKEKR